MGAIRKGRKPTDNPKNFMMRVRLDRNTLEKLDKVCEIEKKTRSEIVRGSIETLYQKTKER